MTTRAPLPTILDRDVIVNGERIAYTEQGQGPPVVLIHGTPSHSYIWRHVLPAVRDAGYRVFAFDLLGFGRSEKPAFERDTSVAAQAELLDELLEHWDVPSAHLVGHDLGGAVSLIVAVRHPERVRSLLLADTVSYDSWPSETWQAIIERRMDDYQAMPLDDFRAMMTRQLRMTVFDKGRMSGATLEAYLAPFRTELGKMAFFAHQVQHYDSRYTEAIEDDLARLTVPVRIVWGENDEWQPLAYGERLRADIPEATLVTIPEAGHFVMEDAPERVRSEIVTFLAELDHRASP
ncbi:MAG: alpha/beta fold hydrolase [Candidatus Bipolaricaulia bacterium]